MSRPDPFGFLLVDKPPGPTSHDVVDAVRRALGVRRVGHTGTLDPFASGLLVVCVGQATRLAEYLVGLDKGYQAEMRLGVETDTLDPEGREVSRDDRWMTLGREDVVEGLKSLEGTRLQQPPAYSAVKVRGVPAHRRTRRGEVVDLDPRPVEVYRITLREFEPPHLTFEVACSSGTYVRSLAHEAGVRWGTGCHLTALRRIRVGPLAVEGAAGWAAVREGRIPDGAWVRPDVALSHLPGLRVDAAGARRLTHGQAVPHGGDDVACGVVYLEEDPIAVGTVEGGMLRPRKVFPRG